MPIAPSNSGNQGSQQDFNTALLESADGAKKMQQLSSDPKALESFKRAIKEDSTRQRVKNFIESHKTEIGEEQAKNLTSIINQVEQTIQSSKMQRGALAREFGGTPSVKPQSPAKPTSTPQEQKPAPATEVKPPSTEGSKPPKVDDKAPTPVPTPTPAPAAQTPQTTENTGNTPDSKPTDSNKTKPLTLNEAKSMSTSQLMSEFAKLLSELPSTIETAGKYLRDKLSGAVNSGVSRLQTADIKLNLNENKDTKYENQNKSAEYICSLLNLPPKSSAQQLLNAIVSGEFGTDSQPMLQTNLDKMEELVIGDIMFFKKDKNDKEPYLSAIVSRIERIPGQKSKIVIRTIPPEGGAPRDFDLNLYKNQFYGYVKIPQAQKDQMKSRTDTDPAKVS